MKILLAAINAKYIHSNLAVYSLKACTEHIPGIRVAVEEFTINNYIDEILTRLYREKPDVLAFSCYIWNLTMVEELIDLMRKAAPEIKIWLGGPEVSYDAADVLRRNPGADLVMRGEGEDTFRELVSGLALNGGSDKMEAGEELPGQKYAAGLSDEKLAEIPGLTFRKRDGNIVETGERPPVLMDSIPFPYKNMDIFKNRIIYYESSRGCPFSCSYCLSSIDRHVRFRSLSLVLEELGFFLDHKVPQVKFVDRTFNCRHDRTLAIWKFIKDHDNGVTNFHFEVTADLLNEEELELLATLRPGLIQLEIGVQSTNPKTIKAIDRVMDFAKLSRLVQRIQKGKNVHVHLDLIAGLPWEDIDSFIRSFNDVYALRPNQLQMGFLKVLKGSKMHQHQKDYGLVYRTKPVYEVMSTRWITFDEILFLKDVEEMVEIYYNTAQFTYSLEYLLHFFKTPFDIFKTLAIAYREQVTDGRKFSRLDRYDLLRRFAKGAVEETPGMDESPGFVAELFDDILRYDYYLREKAKTRPSWAPDTERFKKEIAAFYSSLQMREKYFKEYDDKNYRQIRNLTHVEIFSWDIVKSALTGIPVPGKNGGVLFMYRHRDSLTYEAQALPLGEDLPVGQE